MAAETTMIEQGAHDAGAGPTPADLLEADLLEAARQIDEAIREIQASDQISSSIKEELISNLRSLRQGLGPTTSLALIRNEVNAVLTTLSTRSSEANSEIGLQYALTAEAAARVSARVAALQEGRIADYYFETIDPHHLMDPVTRAFVGNEIENNPEIKANADSLRQLDPEQLTQIETGHERGRAFLEHKLAHTTGAEHAEWARVEQFRLMGIPGMAQQLRTASPQELHVLVESAMENRISLAKPMLDRLAGTPEGRYLRQIGAADGYGNADVRRILEIGTSPEGLRALRQLAEVHGDYSKLPENLRGLAAAANFAQQSMANSLLQDDELAAIRNLHAEIKPGEVGHSQHFQNIFDKALPIEERARLLAEEFNEHGGERLKSLSPAARLWQARQFISQLDLLPNPQESVLGQHFQQDLEAAKLQSWGNLSEQQAAGLRRLGSDPSFQSLLSGAVSALDPNNTRYGQAERNVFREQIVHAGDVLGDPAFQDSLSKVRYYNLNNTVEGRSVLLDVLSGQTSIADGARAIDALQQATLQHMTPLAGVVPSMLSDEYSRRLATLEMFNADGSLNVEKLVETARRKRDALGDDDKAIAAIVSLPWEQLTEEQRDRRVVAQATIRFKAIDAVQSFGRDIAEAYERIGNNEALASEQLKQDFAQYKRILDNHDPQAQREAITALLQQQQYLRVNESLREEVTNNIMQLSTTQPQLLTNTEYLASDYRLQTAPFNQPDEVTAVDTRTMTSSEIAALNREGSRNPGDDIFENRIENRIKRALKGHDMSEIIATFGQLVGNSNVGNQGYLSANELENALMAVPAVDPKTGKPLTDDQIYHLIDKDGDNQLTIQEMVDYLRTNGQLTPIAGGQAATVVSATTTAPAAVPAVQPQNPAQAVPGAGR